MATLLELRTQIVGAVQQQRTILEAAEADSRELTAEETGTYESLEESIQEWEADEQAQQEAAQRVATKQARSEAVAGRLERLATREPTQRAEPVVQRELQQLSYEAAIQQLIEVRVAGGDVATEIRTLRKMDSAQAHSQLFKNFLRGTAIDYRLVERAALQMDSDTSGGVLVAPIELIQMLIDGLDDMVVIRGIATVLPFSNAAEIRAPSLDNDPADADWTVELSAGTEDTTMSFGARSLSPHPLRKFIKVSKDLLRQASFPVESIVMNRLTYKFGVTEEKAFLTGSGAGQPLGVFTASGDGISTSRDVSTDNTTTAMTADGLIEAKYSLKEQYQRSGGLRWVFHRDGVKQIRKLKDGNGDYLWQRGLATDRAATILDVPYISSEFAPSTFTTGLYVGLIGDFSYYWIAEVHGMELEIARELHLGTWQDGFYGSRKLDAMPVLEEAFARVTLA